MFDTTRLYSLAALEDELAQKYPNISEYIQDLSRSGIEKKYLRWAAKQLNDSVLFDASGHPLPGHYGAPSYVVSKIEDYIGEFKTFYNMLENKDLYSYTLKGWSSQFSH